MSKQPANSKVKQEGEQMYDYSTPLNVSRAYYSELPLTRCIRICMLLLLLNAI